MADTANLIVQSKGLTLNLVRKATAEDVPILVPLLARSFASQPLTRWMLGDDEEALRKGERILELDFENALQHDLTFTTTSLQGAALWRPPERRQTAWRGFRELLRLFHIIGISRNLPAQIESFRKLEKLFPRIPNYYLSTLAVAPDSQGQGIGSALLKPVLELCDTRGIIAYTVTDVEPNVAFYRKHGFSVQDAIPIRRAGLTAWTMWREPRENPKSQY